MRWRMRSRRYEGEMGRRFMRDAMTGYLVLFTSPQNALRRAKRAGGLGHAGAVN
jgi:hypothetical protein